VIEMALVFGGGKKDPTLCSTLIRIMLLGARRSVMRGGKKRQALWHFGQNSGGVGKGGEKLNMTKRVSAEWIVRVVTERGRGRGTRNISGDVAWKAGLDDWGWGAGH